MKNLFFTLTLALVVLSTTFVPFVASAQAGIVQLESSGAICHSTPQTFKDVICIFISILLKLLPLLVAVAFLVFFWGIVQFIYNAGNETVRAEAKNIMFWGVIALFVMVSIMGIVTFFTSDFFGVQYFGVPHLPTF